MPGRRPDRESAPGARAKTTGPRRGGSTAEERRKRWQFTTYSPPSRWRQRQGWARSPMPGCRTSTAAATASPRIAGMPVVVVVVDARRLGTVRRWEQDLLTRFPKLHVLTVADVNEDAADDTRARGGRAGAARAPGSNGADRHASGCGRRNSRWTPPRPTSSCSMLTAPSPGVSAAAGSAELAAEVGRQRRRPGRRCMTGVVLAGGGLANSLIAWRLRAAAARRSARAARAAARRSAATTPGRSMAAT